MTDGTRERVTYATLAAGQTEDFRHRFDAALETLQAGLGATHTHLVAGASREGGPLREDRNPSDTRRLLGRFPDADTDVVAAAVGAARLGYRDWSRRPWAERVEILRRAAELIEERGFELSALVSLEVGKNRLEAMGDITETADLVRYYCEQMERNWGFEKPMQRLSPHEDTSSVLRPYGVWGVISPFNFPAALSIGPASAVLVAGNTAVLKPSPHAPLTALALVRLLLEAGVPPEALQLVFGAGSTGQALAGHADLDGLLFTGSKAVGMGLLRGFGRGYPKPCITEMGGKNPALVMASADLAAAAEGILRSAFGLQGQKCSACSRVLAHERVAEELVGLLVENSRDLEIGDASRHDVFLGPVIDEEAYARFSRVAATARRDGRIRLGGEPLREGELVHGWFVAPTIVDALPPEHALLREELFLPFVCIESVASLDEALRRANATEYGLTAGFFSRDEGELREFLERIEAGVVYVNRRAGATTGAWPGVQPFGGWKGSGSSGKASGGLYYVQQFLREQSRTIVR